MLLVTEGELYVWFLELSLLAWGGGVLLQSVAARRFAGQDSLRRDYTMERRPWWAAPTWLFVPVWVAFYVGVLPVVGYLLRLAGPWGGSPATAPLILYVLLQFALMVWPAVYAGAQYKRLGIAVHAVALALCIALTILAFPLSTLAGALLVALCAWLAYALALAIAIDRMRNYGGGGADAGACGDEAHAQAQAPAPAFNGSAYELPPVQHQSVRTPSGHYLPIAGGGGAGNGMRDSPSARFAEHVGGGYSAPAIKSSAVSASKLQV